MFQARTREGASGHPRTNHAFNEAWTSRPGFFLGATEDAIPIPWTTNIPVWVPQWPLSREKLEAAQELVREQLALGHLEMSQSPWNTPIFVIKKKSGKWRLLHDLRAVNQQMQLFGSVQRGLPLLSSLPRDWPIIIIDIKDCFFSIPLNKEDCPRFAFTIPSINHEQPDARYQWRVLPQGMANSSTMCQLFVQKALEPVHQKFPNLRLCHYMDDVLIAAPTNDMLDLAFSTTVDALRGYGLEIAPEKVQKEEVGRFLGAIITPQTIRPQKISLRLDNLKTLNDFQRLLGDINWLWPYLRLTTAELRPLFKILEGDPKVTSPRMLTQDARETLKRVEQAIQNAQLRRYDENKQLVLCILPTKSAPTAVLWQDGPLLWIHAHASIRKTIEYYPTAVASIAMMGIKMSLTHFAMQPQLLIQPYTPKQVQVLSATLDDWAVLVCAFSGRFDNHYPSDKLLHFVMNHPVIFPKVTKPCPLDNAITVYTDGSSSGMGAYVVQGGETVIKHFEPNRPQIVECQMVLEVFLTFTGPLNIYSDSHYVVNAINQLESSAMISDRSPVVSVLLSIRDTIRKRSHPFHMAHIRAHTLLPGPMAEANARADQ